MTADPDKHPSREDESGPPPVVGIGEASDHSLELAPARERVQAALDALDRERDEHASPEEQLLSVTEEYKLTLEELETTKDELKSSDEELLRVNDELQRKLDALTRVNDDLKNLMAATDVAILFLDRELRVQRFTPPATRLLHLMPHDEGRPLSHLTRRFDHEGMLADAEEVLETQGTVERDVTSEDGRRHLLRMAPYHKKGQVDGVVVTLVDVTRLDKGQAARKKIAEPYRLLVDNVREYAIILLDTEGCITDWNRGAERLLGYPAEEAMGRPIAMIFTEEAREEGIPERELATAAREGQANDDRWHVRRDGSRFWVSGVMTALYEEDGSLRGFAKILRDDTERKEIEQAHLHFQALFESAPGLYCVVDPVSYEVCAASDEYLRATMTRREDLIGRRILDVFPDDPDEPEADGARNFRASVNRVKSSGRADVMPVQRYPIPRRPEDGGGFEERFWSQVNSPVFGSQGELQYIIHRVEDVTPFILEMRAEGREKEGHRLLERRAEVMEAEIVLRARELKQANEALHELNETLEARVREQTRDIRDLAGRLTLAEQAERHRIARVLHDELRQILFGAQMKLSLLRQEARPDASEALERRLTESSRLIETAIDTARHLSVDLSPNILDGEGLADALGWLAPQMEEIHGLTVRIEADSPVLVPDEGLRVLLFQAVRELLFKVAKNAEVDRADVSLFVDEGGITIQVSDVGHGFDPSDTEGDPSTSGLANVRERLRVVGGSIGLASIPGEGTRVTVRVPRAPRRGGTDGRDAPP